jgi:hypothetical protein
MQHFSGLFPRREDTEPPQTVPADPSVVTGPSDHTFMPTQSGAFLSQGVSIKGTLTVGEHARIRGDIRTKSVNVRGTVEGNIFVTERCELQAGCTLHGDIEAPRLVVDENVTFCGNAKVGTGKWRPAVEAETPETTVGDLKTIGETAAVATFQPECIGILEQRLGAALLMQARSLASPDGSTVVICKASRTYIDRSDYAYRFGLYEF